MINLWFSGFLHYDEISSIRGKDIISKDDHSCRSKLYKDLSSISVAAVCVLRFLPNYVQTNYQLDLEVPVNCVPILYHILRIALHYTMIHCLINTLNTVRHELE